MLNQREEECLYWAAQDKSIEETAVIMSVSQHTIKQYRHRALKKLQCKSITGAIYKYYTCHQPVFDNSDLLSRIICIGVA